MRAMLERAGENPDFKELLPVMSLGGLAGLRVEEIMRLNGRTCGAWRDTLKFPRNTPRPASAAL